MSGFGWCVVREKWDEMRRSFGEFDVARVAGYGEEDITRLLGDARIIRNKRKILATIDKARTMSDLDAGDGFFHRRLRSLDALVYYSGRRS